MNSIVDIFNFDLNTLKDFEFNINTSEIDYKDVNVFLIDENNAFEYILETTEIYSKLFDYQIVDKYLLIFEYYYTFGKLDNISKTLYKKINNHELFTNGGFKDLLLSDIIHNIHDLKHFISTLYNKITICYNNEFNNKLELLSYGTTTPIVNIDPEIKDGKCYELAEEAKVILEANGVPKEEINEIIPALLQIVDYERQHPNNNITVESNRLNDLVSSLFFAFPNIKKSVTISIAALLLVFVIYTIPTSFTPLGEGNIPGVNGTVNTSVVQPGFNLTNPWAYKQYGSQLNQILDGHTEPNGTSMTNFFDVQPGFNLTNPYSTNKIIGNSKWTNPTVAQNYATASNSTSNQLGSKQLIGNQTAANNQTMGLSLTNEYKNNNIFINKIDQFINGGENVNISKDELTNFIIRIYGINPSDYYINTSNGNSVNKQINNFVNKIIANKDSAYLEKIKTQNIRYFKNLITNNN